MKYSIKIEKKEPLLVLNTGIVYAQRKYWCGSATHPLKLSLLLPRIFFPYDEKVKYPLIVWICGGGFTEMNRDVWMPELAYFAKHGFAVASVEYTTAQRDAWPQQLVDIKEAIRWLRAHEGEYSYNAEKIAVMGESAGGYFSAAVAATGETREYDLGAYLEQSSAVQAAVPFYPPVNVRELEVDPEVVVVPRNIEQYLDPRDYITDRTPPFLIFHGMLDSQVPYSQGEELYEALQKAGVESDLYLVEGAEHAEGHFFQEETKAMIVRFLEKHL